MWFPSAQTTTTKKPTQPTTLELRCILRGACSSSVFRVQIPCTATVADLRDKIFTKKWYGNRYTFAASDMKLFLAKPMAKQQGSAAWLSGNALEQALKLKDDDFYAQFPLMNPSKKLAPTYIDESFVPPAPTAVAADEVHVLVELPAVRYLWPSTATERTRFARGDDIRTNNEPSGEALAVADG